MGHNSVSLPDYVIIMRQGIRDVGPTLNSRDSAYGMVIVNVKRGVVESTKIRHLIGGVDNHFGVLDEWENKDGIHCDIGAGGVAESGRMALLHEIQHVKLETDGKFGCGRCTNC